MAAVAADRLAEAQLDAVLKALASGQRREIVRFLIAKAAETGTTCCASDEVCACKLS